VHNAFKIVFHLISSTISKWLSSPSYRSDREALNAFSECGSIFLGGGGKWIFRIYIGLGSCWSMSPQRTSWVSPYSSVAVASESSEIWSGWVPADRCPLKAFKALGGSVFLAGIGKGISRKYIGWVFADRCQPWVHPCSEAWNYSSSRPDHRAVPLAFEGLWLHKKLGLFQNVKQI